MLRANFLIVMVGMICMMSGCARLLPKNQEKSQSPWNSFETVKTSYEKIIPHKTTLDEVKSIGFDLEASPNVKILSYLDIATAVQPIRYEDLDNGLKICITAKNNCRAYEFTPSDIKKQRYGNFWLDILNFRRRTKATGWQFRAIIVVVDDVVVYKVWSGSPHIELYQEGTNPLGPFQDPLGILMRGLPI